MQTDREGGREGGARRRGRRRGSEVMTRLSHRGPCSRWWQPHSTAGGYTFQPAAPLFSAPIEGRKAADRARIMGDFRFQRIPQLSGCTWWWGVIKDWVKTWAAFWVRNVHIWWTSWQSDPPHPRFLGFLWQFPVESQVRDPAGIRRESFQCCQLVMERTSRGDKKCCRLYQPSHPFFSVVLFKGNRSRPVFDTFGCLYIERIDLSGGKFIKKSLKL